MATGSKKRMGRFAIQFVVANYADRVTAQRGLLEASKVRRLKIRGVVDCGAVRLVLPKKVVDRLGLTATGKVEVRYADGRTATKDTVEGVYLDIMGRHDTFSAIVEPGRRSALIGAIVLEALDYLVDCTHQKLVPRDPKIIISEID